MCRGKRDPDPSVYWYAHVLWNYPCVVIVISMSLAIALSAIAFAVFPFELDATGGGLVPRESLQAERVDALNLAVEDTYFARSLESTVPASQVDPQQQSSTGALNFIYIPKQEGANVLDERYIAAIRRFEANFRLRRNFSDYCLRDSSGECSRPLSLMPFFYPTDGLSETKLSVDQAMLFVETFAPAFFDRLVTSNYTKQNKTSLATQGFFSYGLPLAGYNNSRNLRDEQREIINEWERSQVPWMERVSRDDPDIEILFVGTGIVNLYTNRLLLNDGVWAGLAVLFVLAFMLYHTKSLFLSLTGILHIVISFPVAFFFVRLAVPRFDTLYALSIFVLLAVGADDVFVLVDAWKQSASVEGLDTPQKRMAWAFKRAAFAMLITSLTTSLAFFANASSTLPPIRWFGVLTGLTIVFNYLLCITYYAGIISIWAHYFEDKCFDKCVKTQCRGVPHDEPHDTEEDSRVRRMRPMERFFYFWWTPFLNKTRWFWVILSLLLLANNIYWAIQLGPAAEPARFLPDDDPLQKGFNLRRDSFNQSLSTTTVHIVFGVEGIDRTGTDPNDPEDLGKVVFGAPIDDLSPATQQFVLDVCESARGERSTRDREVLCPMESLKTWVEAQGRAFPTPQFSQDVRAFADDFAMGRDDVGSGSGGFFTTTSRSDAVATLRFDNATDELRLLQIVINSTMPSPLSGVEARVFYDEWEAFVSTLNANRPSELSDPIFQTSSRWVGMALEASLYEVALIGLGISLGVALVVLLVSSLNIFVAAIAFLMIGAISVSVIATLVWLGWTLGIIESISLSVVVGLAVDYVVHISHAYVESHKGLRHNRTRDAMLVMGISVFSAFLTTLGSGLLLLGTTIIFFSRFGIFICVTVGWAAFWAFVILPAWLNAMGPEGFIGDIRACCFNCCPGRCKRRKFDDDPDVVAARNKERAGDIEMEKAPAAPKEQFNATAVEVVDSSEDNIPEPTLPRASQPTPQVTDVPAAGASVFSTPDDEHTESIDSVSTSEVSDVSPVRSSEEFDLPGVLPKPAADDAWNAGDKVLARWEEDKMWYKAEVLQSNEDGSVDVRFTEYGNVQNNTASVFVAPRPDDMMTPEKPSQL